LKVSVFERPASSISTSCRLISFLSNVLLSWATQIKNVRASLLPQISVALLEPGKQKAASTRGGSGRGISLRVSMHEQGDQDDDRDWHAEKKQK
jgi:hypothetical protein